MASGSKAGTSAPPSDENGKVIRACFEALSATQRYIEGKEKTLREDKEKFEFDMQRRELDLERKEEIHEQRVELEKKDLAEERCTYEETKETVEHHAATDKQHIITLDVGGDKFYTDMRTLERHPDSIFPLLVQKLRPRITVFIDRDSKHFRFILNYMRQGEEVFRGTALRGKDHYDLEEMICDARYYKLNGFMKLLTRHKIRLAQTTPITFKKLFTEKCIVAPNPSLQRYETIRPLLFKDRNMTGILFENVHFKHKISFEGSLLNGAIFRHCVFDAMMIFTGADISGASFDCCEKVASDRIVMDGKYAIKCGVTVTSPVNIREFTITYHGNGQ